MASLFPSQLPPPPIQYAHLRLGSPTQLCLVTAAACRCHNNFIDAQVTVPLGIGGQKFPQEVGLDAPRGAWSHCGGLGEAEATVRALVLLGQLVVSSLGRWYRTMGSAAGVHGTCGSRF